jgi:hypothetical protein
MRRWGIPALLLVSLLFVTPADAANLVNNGNGTVTDNRTGLTWQQGEPGLMSWGSALSYCVGLSLGGNSDWRLPNIRELESLTDDTRNHPAIDTSFFLNAHSEKYLSSTTPAGSPSFAMGVHFYDGFSSYNHKDSNRYVRCVRGGLDGTLVNITITNDGYGHGSFNADSGTINWSGNTGTGSYLYETQVILSPNPDASSIFGGWSGGGCSGTGNCTVTMESDITVPATFHLKPARIAGSTPAYFTTLQLANDGAGNGNTIEAKGTDFPESLTVSKPLTLIGGYDGSYTTNGGFTTVEGLTIGGGSLTVENLQIQ